APDAPEIPTMTRSVVMAMVPQPECRPERVDPGDDLWRHLQAAPPFTVRLGADLRCRIETELAAEAGSGGGEIEIVDGRVVDHHDVPAGIEPCRDRPHDVLPFAHVDVGIDGDNEFRVAE